MKRVMFLFLLFFILQGTSIANTLKVAPVIGVTMSVITGEGMEGVLTKAGLSAGVRADYVLREKIGFESGLAVTQKGADLVLLDVTLNYLTVPLHARWFFSVGNLKVNVLGGPEVGVFLGGSVNCCGESRLIKQSEFSLFDLGFTVGAGVEISRVTLDIKYTFGFLNINKDSEDVNRNASLYFLVGYNFAL